MQTLITIQEKYQTPSGEWFLPQRQYISLTQSIQTISDYCGCGEDMDVKCYDVIIDGVTYYIPTDFCTETTIPIESADQDAWSKIINRWSDHTTDYWAKCMATMGIDLKADYSPMHDGQFLDNGDKLDWPSPGENVDGLVDGNMY